MIVDSNWPDRDFNFTTKYAADDRQVAKSDPPWLAPSSVSTRSYSAPLVTKSRAACNRSDRTQYSYREAPRTILRTDGPIHPYLK